MTACIKLYRPIRRKLHHRYRKLYFPRHWI